MRTLPTPPNFAPRRLWRCRQGVSLQASGATDQLCEGSNMTFERSADRAGFARQTVSKIEPQTAVLAAVRNLSVLAAACGPSERRPGAPLLAFTATELLVVMAIVLVLSSLMGVAVSSTQSSAKIRRTQALIAKLDAIVGSQFDSYAGRNPVVPPNTSRGAVLREVVEKDLPDSWERVEGSAEGGDRQAEKPDRKSVCPGKSEERRIVHRMAPEARRTRTP